MRKVDYAHTLMGNIEWKRLSRNGRSRNNPLISISRESEEDLARFSPKITVWLILECLLLIPPPSSPSPPSPLSRPSIPRQPSSPPRKGMAAAVKLSTFQGIGWRSEPILVCDKLLVGCARYNGWKHQKGYIGQCTPRPRADMVHKTLNQPSEWRTSSYIGCN